MAEIKQININNATYDINLPSGVSVDVQAVKTAKGVTADSVTVTNSVKAGSVTANSIADTSLKNRKVIGTSSEGTLEAHELAISDIKDLQTTLNGKAPSSHSHTFASITSRGEALLSWGGTNFSGSYGPIDAAMVPELGANRLAFMPADAVTIEYSRDGGSTWTDYGATDSQKINLFNGNGSSFTIGKATSGAGNVATNKYQLRVNIYTSAASVYTALNKFVILVSTNGTNNNWCTIRARLQKNYTDNVDTWATFADKVSVAGWSGYNVINTSGITTYGNTSSSQYGHIQFIFGCDKGSTNNSYAGLQIIKIFGFGGVGWTTPSTMAKTGHMYTYDSSQNVTFPGAISMKGGAVALKSDIKSSTAKGTTGISVSASLAAAPAFTGTAHGHAITDNGHTHTYSKAKASGTASVLNSATFTATYTSDYGIKFEHSIGKTSVVSGIGYDTVNSGSAKTGISLANATAGGSVSKPNVNVSVTDPGHTHTI